MDTCDQKVSTQRTLPRSARQLIVIKKNGERNSPPFFFSLDKPARKLTSYCFYPCIALFPKDWQDTITSNTKLPFSV